MTVRRIILFRYHKNPDICRNRLECLQAQNPNIPVYGLYGGAESDLAAFSDLPMEHNYRIPLDDTLYKWRNSDICVKWWFREYGRDIEFDLLHLIEWDLVFTKPLEKLYPSSPDTLYLTYLKPLAHMYTIGWSWLEGGNMQSEMRMIYDYLKNRHDFEISAEDQLCCLMPGASFPRSFLERYAEEQTFCAMHDEFRVPLFAQAYGHKLRDTGFIRESTYNDYFNCVGNMVEPAHVYRNCEIYNAFHPVVQAIDPARLMA